MMNPAEEAMQRRNTAAFIDAKSTDIILIPRLPVKTGSGTVLTDQPARSVQKLRLIDQSAPTGTQPGTVVGADGRQRKVEFQLLGNWDAVMQKNDYWLDAEGFRLEVAEVLPYNGYERRAQVVRYG